MRSAEDLLDTLLLVGIMAKRGYPTSGVDNWRAVEMCRQIVDIVKRNTDDRTRDYLAGAGHQPQSAGDPEALPADHQRDA